MWGKHLISQLEITETFCYYPPHRIASGSGDHGKDSRISTSSTWQLCYAANVPRFERARTDIHCTSSTCFTATDQRAGVTISRQQRPLQVPSTSNRYGDRTFAASAPRLWNPLPRELKGAATRYVVIEAMASCECYRTMPSGREPRTSTHTLRVDRDSRSDTTANVKVVQIVYCSYIVAGFVSSSDEGAY